MTQTNRLQGRIPAFCVLLACLAVAASADDRSVELVNECGLQGGIVFMPQAADASTPLALAEGGRFIVYAQSSVPEVVAVARAGGSTGNLLAQRLYADVGPAHHLPLAAHSASVVLVDNLATDAVTDANLGAWLTALAPVRGRAILGNHDPARLDAGRLAEVLGRIEGVRVERQENGFVYCRKDRLPGTDSWAQKYHDASNVRSSLDTTIDAPFLPAWYALPTNLGYWGDTIVSAGGRGYLIWANRAAGTSVSLICFDLRSGERLWEQPFSWDEPRDRNYAGYYPGRSCMVAAGDALYLIDEGNVARLDGETGKELGSMSGPRPDGQVKWIGEENGVMAVLGGEPDTYSTSSLQQHSANPNGRELAAYDLAIGSRLWKHTEAAPIDERELAIRDGRLYYHVPNTRVACRDLKTGELVWENTDPEALEALAERETEQLHALLVSCRVLAATPKTLYFSSALLKNRVALDRESGKLLWSEPVGRHGRSVGDVIVGDKVYHSRSAFDLVTNERLGDAQVPGGGCGPSYAGPDYFVAPFGGIQEIDGEMLRENDLKPACEVGVVISEGVAFSIGSVCRCALEIQGGRAFGPAQPAELGQAAPQFQPGPAYEEPAAAVAAAPADWPCYRQSNRRAGATPAAVSAEAPGVAWQWAPVSPNPVPAVAVGYGVTYLDLPEYLPTQAVAVGDAAYFADHQGVIRRLSLADGAEAWSYPVGAGLLAPPAFHAGRIVAGALDGYVYCLDAATGRLAWRYRLPPQDRRIMWYGHLASTWPLTGGVLVQDGVVYAVGGFQAGHGVYAAALDIATGKPLWRTDAPPAESPDESVGFMGGLVAASGRLYFAGGGSVPPALDMKTGALTKLPEVQFATTPRRGKELAALNDDWLIHGGRRTYANINRWTIEERMLGFSLCKTDLTLQEGSMACLGADLLGSSMLPPVFDDELIVAGSEYPPRDGQPVLQAWKTADLLARAAELDSPKGGKRKFLKKWAPYCHSTLLEPNEVIPQGGLWEGTPLPVYAAALCRNAVLVVHPADGAKAVRGEDGTSMNEAWQISALSRETGAITWTVDLPQRVAWDGLSVAADGSVMLALWDGSLVCLR